MRAPDYEGRPANRRRTKVNLWRYGDRGVRRSGVQLRIENKSIWLSPEKAYALANKLVDAAEQAEAAPDPVPPAADTD